MVGRVVGVLEAGKFPLLFLRGASLWNTRHAVVHSAPLGIVTQSYLDLVLLISNQQLHCRSEYFSLTWFSRNSFDWMLLLEKHMGARQTKCSPHSSSQTCHMKHDVI